MTKTVLHIDSSARLTGSATRDLSAAVVAKLAPETVIRRDVATPLPLLDATWVGANFTPAEDRSAEQRATLALSDELVAELQAADTIVIGAPIYNFSIPATLKAWLDQVARAGVTFKYTENGPEGLLTGKRAIIVAASGGTPVGADFDYAVPYLRHMLGFIGIADVEIIAADQQAIDAEGSMAKAKDAVAALAA
ncbi:FMN-dependent NADH-azoreductase [Tritonibacter multivorans]|uniref:FMN dependent NADH:quinone oxidoreductase n=1 Tax=Tritonibacter multivorans TaxID=928856 RepID=A0A0P1GTG5_9RHOB|nr:NAD(P)H-dependent oxidoreductase [Tritonibacter multivorans]MDA7421363.1 NAD(P)H-dependent oxidoreductase [Tritonibacter multivorans]CUH78930.1 FMN-dependent NADH-azoreductase [Tritonibacter multivorans]SFD27481.1 FMN-dependent NADH-azoreductase [Tritonibacter multivorans]